MDHRSKNSAERFSMDHRSKNSAERFSMDHRSRLKLKTIVV
ncbi:hypothetical protein [Leptospira interrogans]|nr:hypothetical protein [Leptospira interrogans]